VNKRARMRLLGVTAIILIVVAAILFSTRSSAAAYETIAHVTKGGVKVGDRVKVGGTVVTGSWNKQSNPMVFTIREETDSSGTGPTLKVIYTGAAPNTFGDGVVAVVTGTLDKGGVVQANEMITKCPSKYESAVGAIPVAELSHGQSMVGKAGIQVAGYVKPGSLGPVTAAQRFYLAEKADGTGKSIAVKFSGALPDTIKDGVQVVVTGTLESADAFTATAVALSQGQK
jgi:cytochrome c-type biogenesis protein CcmE